MTSMKGQINEDLEDIPMAYLWYVVFAIMALLAAAAVVVIRMF